VKKKTFEEAMNIANAMQDVLGFALYNLCSNKVQEAGVTLFCDDILMANTGWTIDELELETMIRHNLAARINVTAVGTA